jgi:ornithine cyclodeaminase
MQVSILTESELRQCTQPDLEAINAIEAAFTQLARGGVQMPPILRMELPENNGEVDVKTAYVPGLDSFALKVSPGFFDNPKLGLPSLNGLMILLSAKTGLLEAILLDNGYLTNVRTAAAGAVAARHLAPEQVETVGVVGAGIQARFQMRALKQVRDFQRLLVTSISPDEIPPYIEDMSAALGVDVIAAESEAVLVGESQIVVTCTPAKSPHLQADWLHPGLHITAMGSDGEGKQELQVAVLTQADVVVCDRRSQAFRLGELQHAASLSEGDVVELGEITHGKHPGRTDAGQITVCDLTGTGIQDTAIALLAYQKAQQLGLGTPFEL